MAGRRENGWEEREWLGIRRGVRTTRQGKSLAKLNQGDGDRRAHSTVHHTMDVPTVVVPGSTSPYSATLGTRRVSKENARRDA